MSTFAKYVVFQSPSQYTKTLLSKHPLYVQFLKKNIELHIQNQNWGFSIGDIIDVSLLNSLLLSWDNVLDFKNI